MLAVSRPVPTGVGWALEPKLDGYRAVVHVGEQVRVLSRPGRDMTSSLPQIRGLGEVVPAGTVLDGEVVSGDGRPSSFYGLGAEPAHAPRRRGQVTFVAFDVLALAGARITASPYHERRAALESLALSSEAWCTVSSWADVAAESLLEVCVRLDVEGLVAKRLSAPYRPGRRSTDWLKAKTAAWRAVHAPLRHGHVRPAQTTSGRLRRTLGAGQAEADAEMRVTMVSGAGPELPRRGLAAKMPRAPGFTRCPAGPAEAHHRSP